VIGVSAAGQAELRQHREQREHRQEDELRKLVQSVAASDASGRGESAELVVPRSLLPTRSVSAPTVTPALPTVIILDAANIAMKHGQHKLFSTRGIELAIAFFRNSFLASPGSGASSSSSSSPRLTLLAFLPDYHLDYEYVGNKLRMRRIGMHVEAAKVPDNIALLYAWRDEGLLVTTAAQDYDDTYTIEYARAKDAQGHPVYVVSNDQYRDYVDKICATVTGSDAHVAARRRKLKQWLQKHVISFTFVGDDFLPNPDFNFVWNAAPPPRERPPARQTRSDE
jgi:hypothetical protein